METPVVGNKAIDRLVKACLEKAREQKEDDKSFEYLLSAKEIVRADIGDASQSSINSVVRAFMDRHKFLMTDRSLEENIKRILLGNNLGIAIGTAGHGVGASEVVKDALVRLCFVANFSFRSRFELAVKAANLRLGERRGLSDEELNQFTEEITGT